MWEALEEICRRERCTINDICTLVEAQRRQSSLTAAIRVFVLLYFRSAATESGHLRAGHGELSRARASRPRGRTARGRARAAS